MSVMKGNVAIDTLRYGLHQYNTTFLWYQCCETTASNFEVCNQINCWNHMNSASGIYMCANYIGEFGDRPVDRYVYYHYHQYAICSDMW